VVPSDYAISLLYVSRRNSKLLEALNQRHGIRAYAGRLIWVVITAPIWGSILYVILRLFPITMTPLPVLLFGLIIGGSFGVVFQRNLLVFFYPVRRVKSRTFRRRYKDYLH